MSLVCSTVAGWLTARVTGAHGRRAVAVLAGALLLTGIVVQLSVWALMPVWYHVLFLACLVPAALLGSGRFWTATRQ